TQSGAAGAGVGALFAHGRGLRIARQGDRHARFAGGAGIGLYGFRVELAPPPGRSEVSVIAGFERAGELDEQPHAAFYVLQIDQLAGRVHVAQRDADQAGGDAAAARLDGAGVGAGRARVGLELVGDAEFLGGLHEPGVNPRVDVGAPADDGAAAELGLAVFAVVAVGVVSGVADIDGERDVRVDRIGRGDGAARADFLLGGGHVDDLRGGIFLERGEAHEGFADDVGADIVVEGAGGADAAVDQLEAVVVGGGVADGEGGGGLLFGAPADVDPDLVQLGDLLAVGLVHEVDGALAGDAFHRPVGGGDDHAPAGDDGLVVAADGVEVEETVGVD